jgi:hypothetical protein
MKSYGRSLISSGAIDLSIVSSVSSCYFWIFNKNKFQNKKINKIKIYYISISLRSATISLPKPPGV